MKLTTGILLGSALLVLAPEKMIAQDITDPSKAQSAIIVTNRAKGLEFVDLEGNAWTSLDGGETWHKRVIANATTQSKSILNSLPAQSVRLQFQDLSGNMIESVNSGQTWQRVSGVRQSERETSAAIESRFDVNASTDGNTVEVEWEVRSRTKTTMTVLSWDGRVIATIFDAELEAGAHKRTINTRRYGTGNYRIQLESEGRKLARAFTIAR